MTTGTLLTGVGVGFSFFLLAFGAWLLFGARQSMNRFLIGRIKAPLILEAGESNVIVGQEAQRFYTPVLGKMVKTLRQTQGDVLKAVVQPRLTMANIQKTPEQWIAEIILATMVMGVIFFAGIQFLNIQGFPVPSSLSLLCLASPLFGIISLQSTMRQRRTKIRAELPGILTVMVALARVAPSFDSPNGVLPSTVRLVEGEATDLLYDVMLEASSTNVLIEDVMEQLGMAWELPTLERIAAAVRLARVHGVGLADSLASMAQKMADEQEEGLTAAANTAAVTGIIPVVIFDIPGGLLLVLFPAFSRLGAVFG